MSSITAPVLKQVRDQWWICSGECFKVKQCVWWLDCDV